MPDRPARSPRALLDLTLQRRLLAGRRARVVMLVLGALLILLWQARFTSRARKLDTRYRLEASSGVHHKRGVQGSARLLYFFYYLRLYPVLTELEEVEDSREGAERILAEHGDTLLMEWRHAMRSGQLGSTFLYLPGAWLRGSPREPTLRPCHQMALVVALTALFVAFWWVGHPLLGLVTVAILGSNPFQLYEVNVTENVFGWPITAAVLVLALHLPILGARKPSRWYVWALPVATGLLLATLRQVRPEPVAMAASAAFAYVAMGGTRWRVRLGLVGLLVVSLVGGSRAWRSWFDCKSEQAREVVVKAGGHPYDGPRIVYHMVWHPVWCGLGDFDEKYGYQWKDVLAARYARPILEEKYGVTLPPWDGKSLVYETAFWDEAGKYYKTPYEMPHYGEVLRDKVVHDVTHDPLWYLGILGRRAWRILSETTPVRLAFDGRRAELPMHGLALFAVLGLLAWARSWWLVKVVCFSFPLSLTALLIYSGRGTCFYSAYHLFVAAIACAWVVEAGMWAVKAWRAGVGRS